MSRVYCPSNEEVDFIGLQKTFDDEFCTVPQFVRLPFEVPEHLSQGDDSFRHEIDSFHVSNRRRVFREGVQIDLNFLSCNPFKDLTCCSSANDLFSRKAEKRSHVLFVFFSVLRWSDEQIQNALFSEIQASNECIIPSHFLVQFFCELYKVPDDVFGRNVVFQKMLHLFFYVFHTETQWKKIRSHSRLRESIRCQKE